MSRLPASASFVQRAGESAKLHAPSAERNAAPILALLREIAPERGRALEIASGTGQHIVALARAMPRIDWQPSDIAADRIASIAAYAAEAGLPNLLPPMSLDACARGWADRVAPYDLVHVTNLLHLVPDRAVQTLVQEAARTLTDQGRLMIYGPFKRAGKLTSPGDARFDSELRGADPAIGYKDDRWLLRLIEEAGLRLHLIREMPANNLAVIAAKGTP